MYQFTHAKYLEDHEVIELYSRVVREGLADSYFYAGQFSSAVEFLRYVRSGFSWLFRVEREGEVVAFGMLDNFNAESAYFHHCHFRAGWKFTSDTAKAALRWLHEVLPDLHTLIGITPATNTLAVRFAKRNGFRILGEIPRSLRNKDGQVIDAVLSVYTWEA